MTSDFASRDAVISQLETLIPAAHILRSDAEMAPFLHDIRGLYEGHALCIVEPVSTGEVSAVMRFCHAARIAVTPIGGNTGLVGGAVLHGGVGLSLRRMNRILSISSEDSTMVVEAGCILQHLQEAAAAEGMLMPISLSAEGSCQIGGNIATNAGGMAALRYGVTRQQVLGLEVVLPDGTVLDNLSRLRKDNAGYDLKQLFIGSEGTLGVITAAVLRLEPAPLSRETAILAVQDVRQALAVLNRLRQRFGADIAAAELIEGAYLDLVLTEFPEAQPPFRPLPPWCLLIALASPQAEAGLAEALETALMELAEGDLIQDAVIARNLAQAHAIWDLRHNISAAARMAGPNISNDSSVPLDCQAEYVRRTREAILAHDPAARPLYVGHLGDGNLHLVILFPRDHFPDRAAFTAAEERFGALIDAIVMDLGGSITAEHGVGLSYRNRLLNTAPASQLALFAQIRKAFDPNGIMNPGKMLK